MVLARQLLARQIVRHDAVRNNTMTPSSRQCAVIFNSLLDKIYL